MVDRAALVVEQRCPVGHDLVDVSVLTDAQEDVDVRPAVLARERSRPRQRCASDALVPACALDELGPDPFPLAQA